MNSPIFCKQCDKAIKEHTAKELVSCSLGIIQEVNNNRH